MLLAEALRHSLEQLRVLDLADIRLGPQRRGAIVFVAAFVPETRGITLEEMEFNLKKGTRLRELGKSR